MNYFSLVQIDGIVMQVRFEPDFAFKRAFTNDDGWSEKISFQHPHTAIKSLFNLVNTHSEVMYYSKDYTEDVYRKLMERMGFSLRSRKAVTPTTFQYIFIK